MAIGFRLHDTLRNKRSIGSVVERSDRLEEIIDLINEHYVDTVKTDLLYADAVEGILSHLDPHTVYIPAEELAAVNEDLEGSFFGIGVEFSILEDTILFTAVIPGGPAERAGLSVGDRIIRVEDTVVAGVGISEDRIVAMLRGARKSRVRLTVTDGPTTRLRPVVLTRDEVPLYSVEAALMLDGTTGFIKIGRFAATTYDEFMQAARRLRTQGAQALVLDLRQNPGGYLETAAEIADEFIGGDKLLVYTQGRASERTEYKAARPGIFEGGRLAVLVDEGSASASEIVAGAVQDWDRGVVIGRRSFGKGLVQEQYDLADGSALRLTTARYYIPSGRSIQRSYAGGREAYEDEAMLRFETGEATGVADATVEAPTADTTRYYTARRRAVRGGGGISPDVSVPYDTAALNTALLNTLFGMELRVAVWRYFGKHRVALRGYRTAADFIRSFRDGATLYNDYLALLSLPERATAVRVLSKPAQRARFNVQAEAQLIKYLFGANGYFAVTLRSDDAVSRALQVLRGPEYLRIIGGQGT